MSPTGGWPRAVAMERPGVTAGTVSGIGLDVGYARILELGDSGRDISAGRFDAFDEKFGTSNRDGILLRSISFQGGKAPREHFRHFPMQVCHGLNGTEKISPSDKSKGW